MARRTIDTHAIGAALAECYVPRGTGRTGGLVLKRTRVLYHDGETAATAEAFAAAQRQSVEAYRAAHPSVPGTGMDLSAVPMPRPVADHRCADYAARVLERKLRPDDRVAFYCPCGTTFRESTAAPVVPEPGAFAALMARTARDHDAIARLAAALDARKGRARSPLAIEASEHAEPVRKARAKVAPSPKVVEIREAIAAEPVPDALATCNACEVRPMVGPEHPGYAAGYCAECYEEATAPDPDDALNEEAARTVLADPEAYSPIVVDLAARIAPEPTHTRPTCPRCGQTFRLSGRGYAWHVANRPQCAATRSAAA